MVRMTVVTLSPKYQVVIPRDIRKALNLEPGQKMEAIQYEGRVELVPRRDLKSMRGFLSGIDTDVIRDENRM